MAICVGKQILKLKKHHINVDLQPKFSSIKENISSIQCNVLSNYSDRRWLCLYQPVVSYPRLFPVRVQWLNTKQGCENIANSHWPLGSLGSQNTSSCVIPQLLSSVQLQWPSTKYLENIMIYCEVIKYRQILCSIKKTVWSSFVERPHCELSQALPSESAVT